MISTLQKMKLMSSLLKLALQTTRLAPLPQKGAPILAPLCLTTKERNFEKYILILCELNKLRQVEGHEIVNVHCTVSATKAPAQASRSKGNQGIAYYGNTY